MAALAEISQKLVIQHFNLKLKPEISIFKSILKFTASVQSDYIRRQPNPT